MDIDVIIDDVINCDDDPFVPRGLTVESHKKHGFMVWHSNAVTLHLEKEQLDGFKGNKLRKRLKDQPFECLNACVLDYLLDHPELIPEEWKSKHVFFWGTIYRNSDGRLYVRCLRWDGVSWRWGGGWLDGVWRLLSPAALASA